MMTQLRIRRARLRGRGIHPSKRLLRKHFPELLGRNAGSSADDFHVAAEIDWNVSVHMRSSEKLAITAPLQGRWRFEEAA
jgi:hypothetical protein